MRADAPLEAGLVERPFQFGRRLGGREVEHGAAAEVTGTPWRRARSSAQGGAVNRDAGAVVAAGGQRDVDGLFARWAPVPQNGGWVMRDHAAGGEGGGHRQGVRRRDRADQVHARAAGAAATRRAPAAGSPCGSTRPPRAARTSRPRGLAPGEPEDPRLRDAFLRPQYPQRLPVEEMRCPTTHICDHRRPAAVEVEEMRHTSRTPSLTSRRSPAPCANSEQSRYEPVRRSASSVMIAS